MVLEDNQDKVAQMDTQESDVVEVVSQDPPILGVLNVDSTPGGKPKRKKHSHKGKTPGGLEETPQIAGGQKFSKEITEDIIWGGLCPEY